MTIASSCNNCGRHRCTAGRALRLAAEDDREIPSEYKIFRDHFLVLSGTGNVICFTISLGSEIDLDGCSVLCRWSSFDSGERYILDVCSDAQR